MNITRRQFVTRAVAGMGMGIPLVGQSASLDFLADKTKDKGLGTSGRFALTRAVLDVLEHYYKGMTLQFWNLPFEKIEFEKRIINIVYWVDRAIQADEGEYYVDPAWVMSQIMAESLFCELAISKSLAAGICQIMPNTATKEFNMVIAGSQPGHHQSPYLRPELANALLEYKRFVKEKNAYRKSTKSDVSFTLDQALERLAKGQDGQEEALLQMNRKEVLRDFDRKIGQAKSDYVTYITTNIETLGSNDIFSNAAFFVGFDERFTYKKPIFAMVDMLANALRVRSGNMLAAAAAYNAGLSRTWTNEVLYTQYGQLPNFSETSRYLSRIVANYEEIVARL